MIPLPGVGQKGDGRAAWLRAWPGNVHELFSAVESAAIRAGEAAIGVQHSRQRSGPRTTPTTRAGIAPRATAGSAGVPATCRDR